MAGKWALKNYSTIQFQVPQDYFYHHFLFHFLMEWIHWLKGIAVDGVLKLIFDWVSVRPLTISKDFSPSNILKLIWLFLFFFQNFHKSGPISKGFLPQKWLILQVFRNFCETGPSSKDFLTKMGPVSKDLWWKSNSFGCHIPICLNMWVVPPPGK